MNTNLPLRPEMNERLQIAIPSEQKRRAFEVAAREGVSVGHLVRKALAKIVNEAKEVL